MVSTVDPGMCITTIERHYSGIFSYVIHLGYKIVGRTAEEGSRTLVCAAVGDEEKRDEIRGAFISTVVKVDMPSNYISSKKGQVAQDKLWNNLIAELSRIEPKIQQIVHDYLTPYAPSGKGPVAQ